MSCGATDNDHQHAHVTEMILPPMYDDGSSYMHAHSHSTYSQHNPLPPCGPLPGTAIGGVRVNPGVYIEQPFREPCIFPPTDSGSWGALDHDNDTKDALIRDACVQLQNDQNPGQTTTPNDPLFVYERSTTQILKDTVALIRVLNPNTTILEFMFVDISDADVPVAIQNLIGSKSVLTSADMAGRFVPSFTLVGGFFDDITVKSERAWGYTIGRGGACVAPQLFKSANMCFVIGGNSERHIAARTIRVIGTPRTGTLDVEIIDLVSGDDDTPLVKGKVGRDLEIGTTQPPFVVRVCEVPVDSDYAFEGVHVVFNA